MPAACPDADGRGNVFAPATRGRGPFMDEFEGCRRPGGSAGVRNHVAVLPVSVTAGSLAEQIATDAVADARRPIELAARYDVEWDPPTSLGAPG
jgi:hypothetical protein